MLEEKYVYKNYIFLDTTSAIGILNGILYNSHAKELKLRQRIMFEENEEVLEQKRLFELSEDPNSDALCDCYKDITIRIAKKDIQVFNSIEKQVEVAGRHYYHCFFSNGDIVIDPTIGQFLRKQNIKPEKFREQNKDLFIDKVYVGLPKIRNITYF